MSAFRSGRHLIGIGVGSALAAVLMTGCTHHSSGAGGPASTSVSTPTATAASPSAATSDSSAAATSTSSPTSSPAPASSASARPDRAAAASALAVLTTGRQLTLVSTATGYQAAAFDQRGHVSFWQFASSWKQVGASTYPYGSIAVGGDPHATGEGTMLTGMSNATFILNGLFSGDSSVDSAAYTTGPNGWGDIKAEPDGNLASSGQGVTFGGLGLENGFYFAAGELETADCSQNQPTAACGGSNRVLKFWRWDGHDFALARRAGLPD
jgi:hypothetical protein